MPVYQSTHPLVQHKLALLRSVTSEPKKFREVVRELAVLLLYEATTDLALRQVQVTTPLSETTGQQLAERIGLVPILRAGLGMVAGIHELLPTAAVWHLGLFRDERTLQPVEYYNKLPASPNVDLCLVLDPMLATGGSAKAAIDLLKAWGAHRIKLIVLIAAPEGIRHVEQAHSDIDIHTAVIDSHLSERGFIVPGLGDAGDRLFGTG